jgi:hypothetical protein
MGMFDRLIVNCPRCNNIVEFQSKAGDCGLNVYDIHNVPPQIALDLKDDSEQCSNCLHYVTLRVQSIVIVTPTIN